MTKEVGGVVTTSPAAGEVPATSKPSERLAHIRSERNSSPVARWLKLKRIERTSVKLTPANADSGMRTSLRTGLRPMLLGGGMNSGVERSGPGYWALTAVLAELPAPSVRTM